MGDYEEHGKLQKWTPCMNQRELDNGWTWGNEIMDEPQEAEILGNGWTYHCYFLPKFS
jgi:hypothetical protein